MTSTRNALGVFQTADEYGALDPAFATTSKVGKPRAFPPSQVPTQYRPSTVLTPHHAVVCVHIFVISRVENASFASSTRFMVDLSRYGRSNSNSSASARTFVFTPLGAESLK